jgi:hypothetical protein
MFFDTPVYFLFLAVVVLLYWRFDPRAKMSFWWLRAIFLWLVGLALSDPDPDFHHSRLLRRPLHSPGPHPMFGDLTSWQWMRWGYLHTDHHLRQFGL